MGVGALLESLLPVSCPVCGATGAAPCRQCWRELRPAPPGPLPAALDRCRSLLAYDGAGRELVARLKYRNARGSLPWLARGMAALVRPAMDDLDLAVVTWAPTTAARRQARGYDHARLLAGAVAMELGLPCRSLLTRLPGPPQTGRNRVERWQHGPAFRARTARVPRSGVLVVDDLLTTGATLTAAASALRHAGAASVVAVTAGRTPFRSAPGAQQPSRSRDPAPR